MIPNAMRPRTQVQAFKRAFAATGNPERARHEKAYLKSDLSFLGVALPEIRRTARTYRHEHAELTRDELLFLVQELWRPRYHELRSLAIALLELYSDKLRASDMARVEQLLRDSNGWAHVDWLSIRVAGALVERWVGAERRLSRWARDENFWIRRAAMLSLLIPLRRGEGNFELFAGFASAMIEEREFFIRKAIGWVLRDVGKKRSRSTHAFLREHIDRVSGLTLREGVKYLPERQRLALMRRYQSRGAKR